MNISKLTVGGKIIPHPSTKQLRDALFGKKLEEILEEEAPQPKSIPFFDTVGSGAARFKLVSNISNKPPMMKPESMPFPQGVILIKETPISTNSVKVSTLPASTTPGEWEDVGSFNQRFSPSEFAKNKK